MKKIIYFILLLLTVNFVVAQNNKKFTQFNTNVKKVKETTTIFIINQQYTIEEFTNMLQSVWTVTPFKVIHHDNFNLLEYADSKYSIMSLGVSNELKKTNTGSITYLSHVGEFYYELLYFDLKELPKYDVIYNIYKYHTRSVGSFPLYSNILLPQIIHKPLTKENASTLYNELYKPNLFTNYNLFQLQMGFKKLNFLIQNNTRDKNNDSDSVIRKHSKNEIKTLASDTLYIPYGVHKRSYMKYKFPYKIVPLKKIGDMIMSGQHIKYLRMSKYESIGYTLNKAEVIDSKTGLPIIKITSNVVNTFNKKLFERINRKIEKCL